MGLAAIVYAIAPRPPPAQALRHAHAERARAADGATVADLTPGEARATLARLDAALARRPHDAHLLEERMHLAVAHMPSRALTDCLRLLRQDPQHGYALTHAAAAYLALGQVDNAQRMAARAVLAEDTAANRVLLGHAFEVAGRREKARAQYRAALDRESRHAAARAALAALGDAPDSMGALPSAKER